MPPQPHEENPASPPAVLALAQIAHAANTSPTFGEDLAFLKKHTGILVLEVPGIDASMGWIHRKNIAKGIKPEGGLSLEDIQAVFAKQR